MFEFSRQSNGTLCEYSGVSICMECWSDLYLPGLFSPCFAFALPCFPSSLKQEHTLIGAIKCQHCHQLSVSLTPFLEASPSLKISVMSFICCRMSCSGFNTEILYSGNVTVTAKQAVLVLLSLCQSLPYLHCIVSLLCYRLFPLRL